MKSGELAARLGVSDSLIRKWSRQYAQFLSRDAGKPDPGEAREFGEADQLLMATVAFLRNEGRSHDEIADEIEKGWRVEYLPPMPDLEVEEARQRVMLVPIERLQRALDRVDFLQNEIERLIGERDQALDDKNKASEQIADLREKLGAAQAKAEMLERMLEDEKGRKRGLFGR